MSANIEMDLFKVGQLIKKFHDLPPHQQEQEKNNFYATIDSIIPGISKTAGSNNTTQSSNYQNTSTVTSNSVTVSNRTHSSRRKVRRVTKQCPFRIDMHGFFVRDVEQQFNEAMYNAKRLKSPCMKVVTGKGNHSYQHVCVIKNELFRVCEKNNLTYNVDPTNEGIVIVHLQNETT